MKILLAGYYGFHNIGDDLLADTALAILKKNNYQVTVLTKAKRKIKKTITLLKECDILLFSGGSLFQDVTGRGLTVLYYFLLFQAAKIFQKKVFFIAQGIGPIKRPINYWLVKTCLKKVDYLTVRNKESAAFLLALGLTKFHRYNDLLFAAKLKKTQTKIIKKKKFTVVFSFRPFQKDYHRQLYKLIERIGKALNYIEIKLVPMQKHTDEKLLKPLSKISGIEILPYNKEKIINCIAQADLAVGMRLHFLILAAKFNIPFTGIVYDPKIIGLCKNLHMPYIYFSDLETLGTVIVNELTKIKLRKDELKNIVTAEEKTAYKAVQELLKEINNVQS